MIKIKQSSTAGMSLIEAMIAAAIVAIIAVSVGYYLTGSRSNALKIEGSGECRQVVEAIINDLKTRDNAYFIKNFLPSSTLPLPVMDSREALPFFVSYNSYRTYQNIDSTATLLQQVYNFSQKACITGPGVDITPYLSSSGIVPSSFTATLQVAAQDLRTSDPSNNCGDIQDKVSPSSSSGNNPWGMWFRVKVTHKTSAGLECIGSSVISYSKDTNAPALSLDANPVLGSDGVAAYTLTNVKQPGSPETPGSITNTVCDQDSVRVPLMSSESGSLFICASVSGAGSVAPPVPADNQFVYCDGMTLVGAGGVPGSLSLDTADAASTGDRPTRTRGLLTFVNMPEGKYRLYVKAVDTAGNISTPALVFFTVDLTRPRWVQNTPILTTVSNAVGLATLPPQGSGFVFPSDDIKAQQFLVTDVPGGTGQTVLYQCATNSQPQFRGQMTTQVGNEFCTGSVSPGGQLVQPNNISGNQCTLLADSSPAYGVGRHTLRGELRDVCNADALTASLPPEAIATATWLNDHPTGDVIQASHAPTSAGAPLNPPITRPKSIPITPTWNIQTQRANVDLQPFPVGLEAPRLAGASNVVKSRSTANGNISISSSDLQTNVLANSCRYGKGFCAKVFNACGGGWGSREVFGSAVVTPFEIKGGQGDQCWTVPCENGFQCSLNPADRGICKQQSDFNCSTTNQWKCTNHADCIGSGNECTDPVAGTPIPWSNTVANIGVCSANLKRYCGAHGDCVTGDGFMGRCLGGQCTCHDEAAIGSGGSESSCQSGTDLWPALCPGVAPVCTCNAAITATMCPADSIANSCGVAKACRGTNPGACATTASPLLLQVNCPSPVRWLGVGGPTSTYIGTTNGGGGGPPYTWQCSLTSSSGPWGSCNYTNSPTSAGWPETAGSNIWFRATDSRGDYAISPTCQYKRDKTPPSFSVANAGCGDSTKPTLASAINATLTVSDNLSQITVTGLNSTRGFTATTCGPSPKDGSGCTSMVVPVSGLAGNPAAQNLIFVAEDEAGNRNIKNLQVYSAAGDIELSVTPGDVNYTRRGFSAGSVAPYSQGLTANITGTNTLNFHGTIRVNVFGSTLVGSHVASGWTNPRSDVRFNTEGLQTMGVSFTDACGSSSSLSSAAVKLDWSSPAFFSHDCDGASRSITGTFGDPHSGVKEVTGNCTDSSGSTNNTALGDSLILTGFNPGVVNCTFDSQDVAGNNTNANDGFGTIRTRIFNCNFSTPTPTPTPTPGGPTPTPTSTPPPHGHCTPLCAPGSHCPLGTLYADSCGHAGGCTETGPCATPTPTPSTACTGFQQITVHTDDDCHETAPPSNYCSDLWSGIYTQSGPCTGAGGCQGKIRFFANHYPNGVNCPTSVDVPVLGNWRCAASCGPP